MNILDAIILGMVEGLTEFLPVSSTAHLAMTARIIGLAQTEFVKTFEIVIQLGAIAAVIVFFWKRIVSNRTLMSKAVIAFIPTGIIGFLLYKVVKNVFLENYLVIVISLIVGGIILILFEKYKKDSVVQKSIDTMSHKDALIVGTAQSLAIIPGVSRAGATIVGGLLLGFEHKAIVEFSFILAIPTILAATLFDFYKNAEVIMASNITPLVVGFVVAFISALFATKFFIKFIGNHSFVSFGIYRIAIGVLFLLIFII